MNNENKKPEFNDQFFIAIMLVLSGWLVYSKVGPPLLRWWMIHETRIVISAAICFGASGAVLFLELRNRRIDRAREQAAIAPGPTTVHVGHDKKGRSFNLPESTRTEHTQLIGATGVGKTVIVLGWAIRDIERGAGVIIIDGKSDVSFLEQLYANVCRVNRQSQFHLFSLAHPGPSTPYNPLLGGTPKQITDRVFAGFTFENGYYRDIQCEIFEAMLRLIMEQKAAPTFILMERLLTDETVLRSWLTRCKHSKTKRQLEIFLSLPIEARIKNVSGLVSQISQFTSDELAPLFNPTKSGINLSEIVQNGGICYFQLPTMYYQILAPIVGKMVLQDLQATISERQIGLRPKTGFVSLFCDDFQDYMYPEFASLFNKSRTANVGVLLSHQSLGDLDQVGTDFRDKVISSTNIKIVMRTNEPVSADYVAQYFGTKTKEKSTERETKGLLGKQKTGEGSVRETEEFRFHPNEIKTLPVGEGILRFPHPFGIKTSRVRFAMREAIEKVPLPQVPKEPLEADALCEGTEPPTNEVE